MEVLVVGGGKVATRKISSLIPFHPRITVVAPKQSEFIISKAREGILKSKRRYFEEDDLKGKDIVIVAVDNIELQKKIFNLCKKHHVFINSVDSPDYCSFIFPSLIVKDDLIIGISTSSKAPAVAKKIRQLIDDIIPENIGEIIEKIYNIRKMPLESDTKKRIIDDYLKYKVDLSRGRDGM